MASKRKKRRKKDTMILKLILLVAVVLVVFEGKLVLIMFSQNTWSQTTEMTSVSTLTDSGGTIEDEPSSTEDDSSATAAVVFSDDSTLAGLPGLTSSTSDSQSDDQGRLPTVSNPDSTAIVREASVSVDDSYFSDAVFIGDSRMEGFRNVSGITQGTFFTSVGMSLSGLIGDPVIQIGNENVTVAAAVSGGSYRKIYLMLGTNDLGEYDLDSFHDRFTSATQRLMELQPGAIFYVCSIIYVEEDKVTTGEYVNNTNVDKLNAILLQICEEQGYYYIDLNEILSDGSGSLIEGASSDGVHIYEKYCKEMLSYLKSHYVTDETAATPETETETETETGSDISA